MASERSTCVNRGRRYGILNQDIVITDDLHNSDSSSIDHVSGSTKSSRLAFFGFITIVFWIGLVSGPMFAQVESQTSTSEVRTWRDELAETQRKIVSYSQNKSTDRFSRVKEPERLLTFLKDGVVLGIAIDQSPSEQVPSTIEYARWAV